MPRIMFAPNRLLTTKEQWLFIGVICAILLGSAALYYYETPVPAGFVPSPVSSVTVDAAPIAPVSKPVDEQAVAPMPGAPAAETPPTASEADIGVAIMGAVHRPGLYFLWSAARVADLIALAGGTTPEADLTNISLTARLLDETTLTIPASRPASLDGGIPSASRRRHGEPPNPPHYLLNPPAPVFSDTPPWSGTPLPPSTHNSLASQANAHSLINVNLATSEALQSLPGIGPVLARNIIQERERAPFMSVDDLLRVPGIGDARLSTIRPLVTAP